MIDQTIANTALPTIARDLHTSASASIWVINAYQLALTMAIIPLAQAGDILGYLRVNRVGMALFVLASLACLLARDLDTLIAARFLQGLAAAAITVTAQPILRQAYPASMLGRATGYNAMAVALGAAAGPVVSGVVLSVASWPWLFAINLPLGLIGLGLSFAVPANPGSKTRFDLQSAVLCVLTFGIGALAFDGFGHGSIQLQDGVLLGVALVFGALFIRRQLELAVPMFGVDLFSRPAFTLATAAAYLSFVGQTIAYIALPFSFQTILGRTPLQVGLLLLPWLLAAAAMAPIAGPLADRFTSSRLAAIGLAIFTLGLLSLTLMGVANDTWQIVWRMALCGVGYGIFQSPNNRSLQQGAPPERAGAPQAVQAMARLTGQTTGAVIVAVVFGLTEHGARAAASVTPDAILQLMALATAVTALATVASVWRGAITGSFRVRASNLANERSG